MNMKRKQAVVISAPRLEGDSIPSIATTAEGNRTRNSSSEVPVLQQLEGLVPSAAHSCLQSLHSPDFLHSITHPQPPAPAREEGTALISATDHASASASPGMGAGAAQHAGTPVQKSPGSLSARTHSLEKEI